MNSNSLHQREVQTEEIPLLPDVVIGNCTHHAARVIPPRGGICSDCQSLQMMMANMALDEHHPVALELVGDASGPSFVVRATTAEALVHLSDQLHACYPQAALHTLSVEEDPLSVQTGETVAACELRAGAAPYLSLRVLENYSREQSEGADPIVNVLAALRHLPEGTRAIAQLAILPARPRWSQAFWRKAVEHPLEPERKQAPRTGAGGPSLLAILVLGMVIAGALLWRGFGPHLLPFIPQWLQQDVLLLLKGHLSAFSLPEKLQLAGLALALFFLLLLLRWVVSRLKKPQPLYNMQAVGNKTKQVAYRVRLRLIVIGQPIIQPGRESVVLAKPDNADLKNHVTPHESKKTSTNALKEAHRRGARVPWLALHWQRWETWKRFRAIQRAQLMRMAAAYRQYHQASGGYFLPRHLSRWRASRLVLSHCNQPFVMRLLVRVLFGKASWEQGIARSTHYLSVEELAALWHLPHAQESREIPLLEQGRASTRLVPVELTHPPLLEKCEGDHSDQPTAFRVGVSEHMGSTLPVFLPPDCFRRNLLAIARTGKGKSTLLLLLALTYLRMHGREGLLFMEPHGDTIATLLGLIPAHRQDDVTLIDLAAETTVVGLNPLDMTQGRDRDKTVENVLTVFIAFWKKQHSWGPRTENVLQFALLTLCEANERKVTRDGQHGPDEQYTLLDVIPLLRDVSFRHQVLEEAEDLALHEWWQRYYETMEPRFQNEVISPVLNKISKYGAERLSRRILGQPRSTVRLRDEIMHGNILLFNTASSRIGVELSSLLGATVMGLFHLTLAEQARLAPTDRRHFLVFIDEFQSYTGSDYNTMLAELRKYGGTFGLATQSLSYLDSLDPGLRATVLSNIDHLFAFLMSAEDARTIAPNLDGLTVDDILNLDDYTCYAKLSYEGSRLPTFSLKLDRPPLPDELLAKQTRSASQERNSRSALIVDEELYARAKARALMIDQQSGGRRSPRRQPAGDGEAGEHSKASSSKGENGSSDTDSEQSASASTRRRRRGGGNRSHSTNIAQESEQGANTQPSPAQSTPLITSSDAGFGCMHYDMEEPREQ